MLERIHRLVEQKQSFAFETTLSGKSYRQMIPVWTQAGYRVTLLFLWLPSADLAVERVANRVKHGGHNISEPDIRRRFTRGVENLFRLYLPCLDHAYIYNAALLPPQLSWKREAGVDTVADKSTWLTITKSAKGSP